jgi:hypothetical protein
MIYDLMYKSTTKATWDAFTLSSGLVVDQDGSVYPAENVLIDEIGPIVTEPAVYDEDGDLVTPAVIDESWHVNVRLIGESFDIPALAAGDEDTEWIDPALVTVPNRIWAGGMNYWVPSVSE